MKTIINFIRREPAMVVSVVLAVANILFSELSSGQEETLRSLIESVLVLIGGATVRANVSPTSGK